MSKPVLSLIVLAVLLLACGTSGTTPAAPVETAPPATPLPPTTEPTAPPSTPTYVAAVDVFDPCALLDSAVVDAALGETTAANPGPGVCLFVGASGTQSVTVAALTGDAAKAIFLNVIAQLQANCSVSFSMQGEATSTPFPPEIQAMANLSLAELLVMQDQVQREHCGFSPTPDQYQRLEGLGDAAYYQLLDLGFIQSGTVAVVRGDTYLSITYSAQPFDTAAARSIGESLVAEALARLP